MFIPSMLRWLHLLRQARVQHCLAQLPQRSLCFPHNPDLFIRLAVEPIHYLINQRIRACKPRFDLQHSHLRWLSRSIQCILAGQMTLTDKSRTRSSGSLPEMAARLERLCNSPVSAHPFSVQPPYSLFPSQ